MSIIHYWTGLSDCIGLSSDLDSVVVVGWKKNGLGCVLEFKIRILESTVVRLRVGVEEPEKMVQTSPWVWDWLSPQL